MNFHWGLNTTCAFLLTINLSCEKDPVYENTIVYGHAGTTLYPERWVFPANTAESVLYAFDVLDAEGVEVDVQMTKDSVLVLYHDGYLQENTQFSGCIPQYNFSELSDLNLYNTKYKLARLEDVLTICFERNRKVYLDLKPFNYCTGSDINHYTFNNALNTILEGYTSLQKSDIIVNSRNLVLLNIISDTSLIKSFETENIQLGIDKYLAGEIDEVCVNGAFLDENSVQLLRQEKLNFTIFGVKTQGEIETALSLTPTRIITDNIAYTRKLVK